MAEFAYVVVFNTSRRTRTSPKAKVRELGRVLAVMESLLRRGEGLDWKREGMDWESLLRDVRDAAHEAEDVLDELGLDKKKMTHCRAFNSLCNISFRSETDRKIKHITVRLHLPLDLPTLLEMNPSWRHEDERRQKLISSLSNVGDEMIVGRDDHVQRVVHMVVSGESGVVAVEGEAGVGKTSLTRRVYTNPFVINHFYKRIWVSLSPYHHHHPNSLVKRVLQDIVKACVSGGDDQLHSSNCQEDADEEAILIDTLEENLRGETCLFVLDDVVLQPDLATQWKHLWDALLGASNIVSKILVTCDKSDGVVDAVHHLHRLSYEDSLALQENLILACIREWCWSGFLPLETNMFYVCLCSQQADLYYMRRCIPFVQDRCLEFCFNQLISPFLKHCFAYTSIFPKSCVIQKQQLIELWMAHGFLQPLPEEGTTGLEMEEIGDLYFNVLLSRLFFQDAKMSEYETTTACMIHGLVHEFSRSAFKNWVWADSELPPDHVRHLSTAKPAILQGKLRTLFVTAGGGIDDNMLSECKGLRALYLGGGASVQQVPESIGKMKYLRYLDLSGTKIKELPEFVTELYYLQTLRLEDCPSLKALPKKMTNLVNLRHLHIDSSVQLPGGIGQLTSLQTLPFFVVGNNRIGELGPLDQLSGRLCISNLGNVRDEDEAKGARLWGKTKLQELQLKWGSSDNKGDVLKGLRPHRGLKGLTIDGVGGEEPPSWISSLDDLMKIELKHCKKWEQLPSLGRLSKLKVVKIDGLDSVKSIQSELDFPALIELSLQRMTSLESWESPQALPCLEKLTITDCPKLIHAPKLYFRSLRFLVIQNVGSSTALENICSEPTSLTTLHIEKVPGLTRLPDGLSQNWKSLTCLKLIDCPELESTEPLHQLPLQWSSFRTIEIAWCPRLTHLPIELGSIATLKNLTIRFCPNLTSIPSVQGLTSLRQLRITDCYELTHLPEGLLSSSCLLKLEIAWCPHLQLHALDLRECASNWLRSVSIHSCGKLTRLPEGLEKLPRLKSLGLGGFWDSEKLDHFPSHGLEKLTSIQELRLYGWAKIRSLPTQLQHLTALKSLSILKFRGLDSLPDWLGDLKSLVSLSLVGCTDLKYLPQVESMKRLSNLKSLRIHNCPELKDRCKAESGSEWPKISHISSLQID